MRRALLWPMSAALLLGCASKDPNLEVRYHHMEDTHGKQPQRVALYMSPEIEAANAVATMEDGEEVKVDVGDYLRTELVRATGRAFQGVVIIPEPKFDGMLAADAKSLEIWPRWKQRSPDPPELIVACYPMEMDGHLVPGGDCEGCSDNLAYRVELYIEIRSMSNELIFSGKVAGQGLENERQQDTLPIAARFRSAVAEAVDMMSTQYFLALSESEIDVPQDSVMPGDGEQYAEDETVDEISG